MPELAEVEAYSRYLAAHALGKPISRVDVRDERILGVRRQRLTRALRGHRFTAVVRHGKNLFVNAEAVWVHFHFGMSGDLAAYRDRSEEPRFARVVFDFEDGSHLAFEDMRLFGVVDLTPSPEAYVREHGLGPDPLGPSFSRRDFRRLLERRRGAIKSLLLSQEIIAGIGNLYADESLFQSAIHPGRSVERLSDEDVKVLHTNIRSVLREAVKRRAAGRELPGHWLSMHREAGELCTVCGGTICRTVVFGRTTYYCGKHQRK